MKDLKHISKFLSLVLRHKPEEIGVAMDANGWVDVDELIEKCTQLFNEHKSFTSWKGQVKEVNSFEDYAQLIIAQMRGQDERTTAEFHVNIYKNSPCYN